jgi:transcriptional regulator with XRE-family HTH domain
MAAEDDVQRVLSLLKRAIRSSGSSQKEVDRKIGVQPGYLSQVMIGRLDLKLKHLLRALDAIEVEPAGFFGLAFPAERGGEVGGGDLLSLLPAAPAEERRSARSGGGAEPIADADLERLVAQALADELGLPVGNLRRAPSMR